MLNKILNFLKATIISLIVAFLFVLIVCMVYKIALKEKFETVANFLQMIAVQKVDYEPIELILENKQLQRRPLIGSEIGRVKIEKIDVDMPMYHGESLDILKKGIGHHLITYLPGEGGSILCMGHNYKKYLQRLPEVENGDIIEVQMDYGTYSYEVYDTKIVDENNVAAAPIQDKEEIFMLYTCYPTYGLGHATQRLIIYAK